jgi:hypothetical protein
MTVTIPRGERQRRRPMGLNATSVPFAGNSFYASTGDHLVIHART